MNRALALIAYNRPEFFEILITSLKRQEKVDWTDYDVWLFLDLDEDYPEKSIDCEKLFDLANFPHYYKYVWDKNVGPGVNMYTASEVLFMKHGYEQAIFLEEDLELHRDYMRTMNELFDFFGKDDEVGVVQCRDINGQPMGNYGLWKDSWVKMKPFMDSYINYIKDYKYEDVPKDEVNRRFGLVTQDAAKKKALRHAGLQWGRSGEFRTKHIGSHGLHFNDEAFKAKGFHERQLPDT